MPWTIVMRRSYRGPRCHPGMVARFQLPCASRRRTMLTAASSTGAVFRTRCESSWTRSCTPPGSWKQQCHGCHRCRLMPYIIAGDMEAAAQSLCLEATICHNLSLAARNT